MTDAAQEPKAESESAISGLIERLQQKVAERKASGEYPPGLVEQLDEHFNRIVFHRVDHDVSHLFAQASALDSSSSFNPEAISTASSVPGGAKMHSVLAKAQHRQTEGILQQTQRFADDVRVIINSLVLAVQDGSSHVHADLVARIDAILERLDSYERAPLDSGAALGDIRRRLDELERREASRQFNPFFTNDAFESNFRGSEEELRERYQSTADLFAGVPGPVVDLGCGRGEFMELLRERNIDTWGIEIDAALAVIAGQAELRVEVGDGVEILNNLDDESLGGVVLLQVIEHLTQQQQLDVVAAAYAKLKPGGRLVMETVNPQSLYVFAHAFYVDPTHTRPVHPLYLEFIQKEIGFSDVKVDWRNEPPKHDQLETDVSSEVHSRNVERLNRLLFAASDYATIATK